MVRSQAPPATPAPRILCHSVCHRPRRHSHLQPRLVGLRSRCDTSLRQLFLPATLPSLPSPL
ncbi:hypothetical protein SNOG_04293 [Parastagonospora nodorum SN15]|uniref:Uncharacterized protein n=1 Tax=Phaeosphaeria nodorum (strain SN15 / ATCC MYA-4574 / FGSC 10173) TaxID=321614 RepID=Q0UVC1_PHANO|nr:hypothetical protein SNOG_04293 [Parastagonospora nodorum SN15]EAT88053.2 hypothetical protein SNOG_04293 [Parastagonospora nodorum SN15]